jgi:NAD(P)-dependent dehydrogenase (short-subunit alcohol dehydrogenase family)
MQLDSTTAIVTGGASGLGAATSRRLAAAGATVVIADLQDDKGQELADQLGGMFVHVDVTDADQVQTAVDLAADAGPLRSLVNCAGIGMVARTVARDGTPHDLDVFKKVIDVNLTGTFNCIRLAAAAMAATEPVGDDGQRGAIVNTSSVAGIEGQTGQVAYSASKGAVMGLTLPVARDLAPVGIRVNTICPGLMITPLISLLGEKAVQGLADSVLNPKRLGHPDEFASLVLELLTNDYMNGEVIRLDGGIRFQPK